MLLPISVCFGLSAFCTALALFAPLNLISLSYFSYSFFFCSNTSVPNMCFVLVSYRFALSSQNRFIRLYSISLSNMLRKYDETVVLKRIVHMSQLKKKNTEIHTCYVWLFQIHCVFYTFFCFIAYFYYYAFFSFLSQDLPHHISPTTPPPPLFFSLFSTQFVMLLYVMIKSAPTDNTTQRDIATHFYRRTKN